MTNKKILVVEDNKKQSELIADCLQETDLYDPIAVYNGDEALAAIKQHRRGFGFLTNDISCILLDWQMPKLSGELFLEKLRQHEHVNPFKHHIPVIVISAFSDTKRRHLAEHPLHGLVCEYLVKPFDTEKLLNLLYRIVFLNEAEVLREIFREQRSRWLTELQQNAQHTEMPK